MIRPELANGTAFRATFQAFLNEITKCRDKLRMAADGTGAGHRDAKFVAEVAGFVIEVVQHFHMIRQETDRRDHGRLAAVSVQRAECIADVRFEPRILRTAAAALIHELPSFRGPTNLLRD